MTPEEARASAAGTLRRGRLAALRAPLPLLAKELTELSARRRTYVMRVVYGTALFLFFLLMLNDLVSRYRGDMLNLLGRGKDLFDLVVYLEFTGIFLFLPGMMSGVLTYEKERESLALLLITDMGPWEIVLQKYLGRLIPMLTFLMMALPPMAIAYSFGGIASGESYSAVLYLLLTCLQVGAFSLMISAYARTTAGAFVSCYLFGLVFYLGPLFALMVFDLLELTHASNETARVFLAFVPPFVFEDTRSGSWGSIVARAIPTMVSIIAFLVLARVFLTKRAFVRSRHLVLNAFKRIDRLMERANRLVGSIVLIKDKSGPPEDDPVAWRELTKKPLGKPQHLIRLLLLLEIPAAFMGLALLLFEVGSSGSGLLAGAIMILWSLSAVGVSVKSANAFVSERANQTLDVLLTTPLPGRDIVRQKMKGVGRLILVLLVPLATLFFFESFMGFPFQDRDDPWWFQTPMLAVTAGLYLVLFAWFSAWVGLKLRSRTRAISTALIAIFLWNLVPIVLLLMLDDSHVVNVDDCPGSWLFLSSPGAALAMLAWAPDSFWEASRFSPAIVSFIFYGFLTRYLMARCLKHADRYLGRACPPWLRSPYRPLKRTTPEETTG